MDAQSKKAFHHCGNKQYETLPSKDYKENFTCTSLWNVHETAAHIMAGTQKACAQR